jgi:hypothetical protein
VTPGWVTTLRERARAARRRLADRSAATGRGALRAARRIGRRTGGWHVWVPLLLGLALVYPSFLLYSLAATPPAPPAVTGAGEVYVEDASIVTTLGVTVDPRAAHAAGRWPVDLTLAFAAPPPSSTAARAVRWAVVLYADARLAPGTIVLPPGVTATDTLAADPPFAQGDRQPVQVISGTTYLTNTNGTTGATVVHGDLRAEVFSRTDVKLALSLPRYGRVRLNPLFQFPDQPGAIDIGIPGAWHRPDRFEIDVDAGPNGIDERIDTDSPGITDPSTLSWQSNETVRALLTRTNTSAEANAQALTFALGAVVGAGAASILTAIERALLAIRRREADPAPAPPGGPADPPAPAG